MTTKNWIGAFSGYDGRKCLHKVYPDGSIELFARRSKEYSPKSKIIKLTPKIKLSKTGKASTVHTEDISMETAETEGLRQISNLSFVIKETLILNLKVENSDQGIIVTLNEASNPKKLDWQVEYAISSGYFMRSSSDEELLEDRLKAKFGKDRVKFKSVQGGDFAVAFTKLTETTDYDFLKKGFNFLSTRKVDFLCDRHLEISCKNSALYPQKKRFLFNGLHFDWIIEKGSGEAVSTLTFLLK